MNKTLLFALVKIADYGSTLLNYSLSKSFFFEANPFAKKMLESNAYSLPLFITGVVLVFGYIEIKYKESRPVQIALSLIILITSWVVVSNLATYYITYKLIHN
jgi:hypothetical protein